MASDPEFPSAAASRSQTADPALVKLEQAAKDNQRRELPGRFSTKPYEGRKGSSEECPMASQLQQAARAAGCEVQVRRFDADATICDHVPVAKRPQPQLEPRAGAQRSGQRRRGS